MFLSLIWLIAIWVSLPNYGGYELESIPEADILVVPGSASALVTLTPQIRRYNANRVAPKDNVYRQASFSLSQSEGVSIIAPNLTTDADLYVNRVPLGRSLPLHGAGYALGPVIGYAHVSSIFLGLSPNRFEWWAPDGLGRSMIGPVWRTDLVNGRAFVKALFHRQETFSRIAFWIGVVGATLSLLGVFFRADRWLFVAGFGLSTSLIVSDQNLVSSQLIWPMAGLVALLGFCGLCRIRPMLASLLGCAAMGIFAAFVTRFYPFQPEHYLKISGLSVASVWPFLLLGLPNLLLERGRNIVSEFVTARAKIADQAALIQNQEAELHAAIRSSAINEERQRFVRDMHDGVGGQLLSLLMQVRSKSIEPDEIELELQRGLHDLRLMADSLDHVGSDLDLALTAFERRAAQQLSAARMDFVWSKSAALTPVSWDGRRILNLYRILQEALTNCIRHSGASQMTFDFSPVGQGLRVTISDNGKGIPANVSKGRGLKNIAKRAEALGAELTIAIGTDGRGTVIALLID